MNKETFQYLMAEAYQPLFDLMQNEYGCILLSSEMDEIIIAAKKVEENLITLLIKES